MPLKMLWLLPHVPFPACLTWNIELQWLKKHSFSKTHFSSHLLQAALCNWPVAALLKTAVQVSVVDKPVSLRTGIFLLFLVFQGWMNEWLYIPVLHIPHTPLYTLWANVYCALPMNQALDKCFTCFCGSFHTFYIFSFNPHKKVLD